MSQTPSADHADSSSQLIQSIGAFAIFSIDPSGHITSWNEGGRELFYYTATEIIGQPLEILCKQEALRLEQFRRGVENVLKGQTSLAEGSMVRKDEALFWAGVSLSPIIEADGSVSGAAVVIADRTEARQREIDLISSARSYNLEKEKNQYFMKALNLSSVIAYTDVSGKFVEVNDRFCQGSGYTREELIGQDTRIMNSGYHSKDFFKNLWETILSGQIWKGEICNKKKDGSLFWAYGPIVPITDKFGKIQRFFTIRQDITKRKDLENQLWISQKVTRDSLEWRRQVLDSANYCVVATDSRGSILVYNHAAERLLGYSAAEASAGMSPTSFFKNDDLAIQARKLSSKYGTKIESNFAALTTDAVRSGKLVESEWLLVRKDRSTIPARVSISTLNGSTNQASGYLFVIQDISNEKRLEQELTQARELLKNKRTNDGSV